MTFNTFIRSCEEWRAHGGMCLYFVCDFNGRWLKDLSLFCCFYFNSKCGR
jgi:hypothetical protein